MKKRIKRIISMFIVAVMLMSMLSVNVMATGTDNGAYAPVDTYGYIYDETAYERIPLEGSAYSAAVAGQIRAIMMNSYPNVAVETIQQQSGISDLTVAEAISAAKIALYQCTDINVDAAYDKDLDAAASELVSSYINWYGEETGAEVSGNDPAKAAIKERIQKVVEYFLALQPAAAQSQLVSTASFIDYSEAPVVTANADVTYNVTVTATVSVAMKEKDAMTLSAVIGDGTHFAQAALVNGQNTVTLTIENVPAELAYTEIKLAIDGTQTADKDVFLFTAKGEETDPQPFVMIDASQFPVHAEVIVIPPMEITLKKTAVIREQGADGQLTEKKAPLEGIGFDVYRLDDANVETYVTTLITDVSGGDVCNLTALEQQPGTFKIVEKAHPAITSPAEPVLVTLPYASHNGNVYRAELAFVNTIKSEVYNAPQVRADVTQIENNMDSFRIGEVHTWIIRGDIPVDIAVGKEYVIADTLDYRLSYAGDANMQVKVGPRNGEVGSESFTLVAGEHYNVSSAQVETAVSGSDAVKSVASFEVRLTPAGMSAVAGVVGAGNFSDYEIRVYFKAVMDEDAPAGELISNQAALHYTNYVNYHFTTYSDMPAVYTCSITVYKHDAANVELPLSGATFKLARVATDADAAEEIKPLVVEGNTINVVYEDFYTKSGLTAEDYAAGKSLTVTTDMGFAYLYGLEEGDYYLIETKAPGGYNLLDEPILVSVRMGGEGQTPCLVKYVANSSNFELPPTGGIGTVIFTVGGAILIGAAIVILILNKKKENAESEEE